VGQVEWGERIGEYAAALVQRTREATGLGSLPTAEVIFLPDIDSFSRIAGIPTDRLEASGTVATTLFGRIFLLSPGAFPNGYAWHIVLSHETVHDAVHRSIPGKLPHFLEEGIATLLEEWAPYGRLRTLAPMERALLFAAKEHKLLLTAEELNAPYWNLGDGLRARLAFLQALTGALVLQHKGSDRAVADFFAALANPGTTWGTALRRVTDLKKSSFQTRMRKRWTKMASREYLPSFLYSDGNRFLSEKGQRAVKEASRTTLLGDLLWGRGHRAAALQMYDRAADELQPTPELAWRTVRLLIEEDRLPEAQTRVEATLARHPRDARVQYAAALLYRATGNDELARQATFDAWLLNPFAEQTDALMANTPVQLTVPIKENTP
jgi:tetratricopeptide (TPR) repeat protein